MIKSAVFCSVVCLLSACAYSTDEVTFVTSTEFGVSADSNLGTANVGFARQEMIITPVDENGKVQPMYATIKKDDGLFDPKIAQAFATGGAAEIITISEQAEAKGRRDKLNASTPVLTEGTPAKPKRKALVFGTKSTIGFKVAVNPNGAEFELGYKRKESAQIPSHHESDGKLPSLFGSLQLNIDAPKAATEIERDFEIVQVIATGKAANNAAFQSEVRAGVAKQLKTAVEAPAAAAITCGKDQQLNAEKTACEEVPG